MYKNYKSSIEIEDRNNSPLPNPNPSRMNSNQRQNQLQRPGYLSSSNPGHQEEINQHEGGNPRESYAAVAGRGALSTSSSYTCHRTTTGINKPIIATRIFRSATINLFENAIKDLHSSQGSSATSSTGRPQQHSISTELESAGTSDASVTTHKKMMGDTRQSDFRDDKRQPAKTSELLRREKQERTQIRATVSVRNALTAEHGNYESDMNQPSKERTVWYSNSGNPHSSRNQREDGGGGNQGHGERFEAFGEADSIRGPSDHSQRSRSQSKTTGRISRSEYPNPSTPRGDTREEVPEDSNQPEVHRTKKAIGGNEPESRGHPQQQKKHPRREGSRHRERSRSEGQQGGHGKQEDNKEMSTDQYEKSRSRAKIPNAQGTEKMPAVNSGHGQKRRQSRVVEPDRNDKRNDKGQDEAKKNPSREPYNKCNCDVEKGNMNQDGRRKSGTCEKSENKRETKDSKNQAEGNDKVDFEDELLFQTPDQGQQIKPNEYEDKLSFIQNNCKKENKDGLMIYKAKLRKIFSDEENMIRKGEFGRPGKSVPEKVVMMVGSTGSGKSTMIDAIFNYVFGIQWNDEYRLKLIPDEAKPGQVVNQAESQTQWITAYTIHHQPWFTVPYTLTIVDTPGFGDTGGIKRDNQITDQIRKFFTKKDKNGIDHLDVVGFVTQSSLARLAPAQRYVFDSILSIFGKDIEQNIFMLLTFADGRKPQVLSSLKEANMEYKKFYKFNNSVLFVGGTKLKDENSDEDEEDDNDFNEMFWKMGSTNFNKFMTDFENVQSQSLTLTAKVLEERLFLETTIYSINKNIKRGLRKLEKLKTEQELLKMHEADIDRNKDFKYEYEEEVAKAVEMPPGTFAANCTICRYTCHHHCYHWNLSFCWAISWIGDCRQCPQKCPVVFHEKQPFRYEWEVVKCMQTSKKLKRRYEDAAGKKLSANELIKRCKEDFNQVRTKTLELTEDARECLARLDEIALKPNPLSTTDYIDLMIQEEEFMKEPGWKETVEQLKEVKKSARDLRSVTSEGFNPFGGIDTTF